MDVHTHAFTEVPQAARVITMALSMITISVLAVCLTRRVQFIKNWKNIPMTTGLIIAIYVDSFLFIFFTAVISKAYSLNQSAGICDGAILLCLLCYMTTKIMIYYFLVEKVYIIRCTNETRMKSKLWLFNFFGVICPYVVLVILNFVYRIAYINDEGVCVIGMKRKALVPLIVFDVVLNVYLTSLFLHPLRQCYSFQQNTNSRLKTLVMRTFIGSCATLVMSVANLSVITILDGEPGYICLCLCNIDILFTVLVLHWATAVDRPEPTMNSSTRKVKSTSDSKGLSSVVAKAGDYIELDDKSPRLTTRIEANRNTLGEEVTVSHAIEVKTQHVQEIEIERYEVGNGSGVTGTRTRESQERMVRPDIEYGPINN